MHGLRDCWRRYVLEIQIKWVLEQLTFSFLSKFTIAFKTGLFIEGSYIWNQTILLSLRRVMSIFLLHVVFTYGSLLMLWKTNDDRGLCDAEGIIILVSFLAIQRIGIIKFLFPFEILILFH